MPKFEVTTDLVIHTKIKIIVEATDKASAIEAAASQLPANHDMTRAKRWAATVTLKPPRGVEITECRPYHFEQADGAEKVRLAGKKVAPHA